MTALATRTRGGAFFYWTGAALLVAFGFLAIFSIGAPFLFTGVAMLAVGRWRDRPDVLWPTLVAVWAFVIGYVLVAPLGCTGTATAAFDSGAVVQERTTCSNVLRIDYSGSGDYQPPHLPAVAVGLAAAGIAGVVVHRVAGRSRSD